MKRDVQTKVLEMKNLDLGGTQWRICGQSGLQKLQKVLSTQLNLNINLS